MELLQLLLYITLHCFAQDLQSAGRYKQARPCGSVALYRLHNVMVGRPSVSLQVRQFDTQVFKAPGRSAFISESSDSERSFSSAPENATRACSQKHR